MNVKRAPKFVTLASSRANLENRTAELLFGDVAGNAYAVELARDVTTPMLATIIGHATDLLARLPEGQTLPTHALVETMVEIAMNPRGDLACKMTLESGLELAYQVSKHEFRALETSIAAMRQLMDRTTH